MVPGLRCLLPVFFFFLVSMISVFWNCQGAAAPAFMRAFKDLVRTYKPDMVALFEPRISGSNADDVCRKMSYAN